MSIRPTRICPACNQKRRFRRDMCGWCAARLRKLKSHAAGIKPRVNDDMNHLEIERMLNEADNKNWNLTPHWERNEDGK